MTESRESGSWLTTLALAAIVSVVLCAWILTSSPVAMIHLSQHGRWARIHGWEAWVVLLVLAALRWRRRAAVFALLIVVVQIAWAIWVVGGVPLSALRIVNGLGGASLLPLFALGLVQLLLALAALRALRSPRSGLSTAINFSLTALLACSALAIASNVRQYLRSPERRQESLARERVSANVNMLKLELCLEDYRSTHGDYPDALEALRSTGGSCIPAERVSDPFPIRYDRTGPQSYRLVVRERDESSPSFPRRVYETDETGVVFFGVERPGATKTAIRQDTLWLQTIDNCLEQYRRRRGTYPETLRGLDRDDFGCLRGSVSLRDTFEGLKRGRVQGHRYIYTPSAPDANGGISSFRLDVRPVRFGHGFTTSFLCDPRGELRATDEDRPAQHTDRNVERDEALDVERPYYCVGQRRRF